MKGIKWNFAQSLEKRWWQKYLQDKDPIQYLNWKKAYWKDLFGRAGIDISRLGAPVLDIGCGPAGVFMILDPFEVVAVDPLLEFYQAELPIFTPEAYPWVHFVAKDFESWDMSRSFQTITCFNAINHFHDPDLTLKRIAHFAQKGATILISIDTHKHSVFKFLFRCLPIDALHPHQWDNADCLNKFKTAGLRVVNQHRLKGNFLFHYDFFQLTIES